MRLQPHPPVADAFDHRCHNVQRNRPLQRGADALACPVSGAFLIAGARYNPLPATGYTIRERRKLLALASGGLVLATAG